MATKPSRAFLHQVVTSESSPNGISCTVAYLFDEDHDIHLAFATAARFETLSLLPLMQGLEINLMAADLCLEVLPLHLQSEDVQYQVAAQLHQLSPVWLGGAGAMSGQPTRAVLQKLTATATSPDGLSYMTGYVVDADQGRHLVYASSSHVEDLRCLPLMKGQEIHLTGGSPCPRVLPLHLQSDEVQQHVAEQLSWLALEPLFLAGS